MSVVVGLVVKLITLVDWLIGILLPAPPGAHRAIGASPTTPPGPGESPIYRAPGMVGAESLDTSDGSRTMVQLLANAIASYGRNRALGWRTQLGTRKETRMVDGKPKEWEMVSMSEAQYLSFNQLDERVAQATAGLLKIPGVGPRVIMGLYEDTRPEWLVACHAAWRANLTVATVYANLGNEAVSFVLGQTELPLLVTKGDLAAALLNLDTHKLTTIVYFDSFPEAAVPKAKAKGITLIPWADVLRSGSDAGSAVAARADLVAAPSDLAMIMYTSGTTGTPKGVEMTHGNLTVAAGAIRRKARDFLPVLGPNPTYCAYLPLAHVLELLAEHVMLSCGAMLGYGSPRTLTDDSTLPRGDLGFWAPSLLTAVPRVLDTIRKGVLTKVDGEKPTKRMLALAGLEAKQAANAAGRRTPVWDALLVKKFRERVGGRVVHIISGGAPLSGAAQRFVQAAFGVAAGQGYGLTETCAVLSLQDYGDYATQNVGGLLDCVEVKLVDVPEMGYLSTDRPNPRGEIFVRGPHITRGYFKEPKLTAEAYVPGGWFRTGDVGELLMPFGRLRVVDRVKNLVKMAHGEYVAVERLESVFGTSRWVMPNGLCVIAESTENFLVGLVLASKPYTLKTLGVGEDEWPAVLDRPDVRARVLGDFQQLARENKFKPFEQIKALRLLPDEWTPENGLMTAAQKLKRREVRARYDAVIKEMLLEANGGGPKPAPKAAAAK